MKKINKDLIIINISILSTIIIALILAILYKWFSYKNDIEKSLETSVKVQELYNDTNSTTIEEEKRKDVDSNTTDWELLLVNKNHKIPDGYGVNLKEIELVHKIDSRIADKLEEMLLDARKEGLDPIICSSYRTNEKQKILYNNKVKEHITHNLVLRIPNTFTFDTLSVLGKCEIENIIWDDRVRFKYAFFADDIVENKETDMYFTI